MEPHFTLTCTSTGGPATTVRWTRESGDEELAGDRLTVVTNTTTAEYVHVLNVTGRQGGSYTCTVSNSAPSNDTATTVLAGMILNTNISPPNMYILTNTTFHSCSNSN